MSKPLSAEEIRQERARVAGIGVGFRVSVWCERMSALLDEVESSRVKLAALRTLADDPGGPDTWSFTFEGEHGIFANDVRVILDGPTP